MVDNITATGLGYLLSVKLDAFNTVANANKATVSFAVSNTEKNSRYLVERSADGNYFNMIYSVEETNSDTEKKYSYTDDIHLLTNTQQVYYRIHLISAAGTNTYSAVMMVKTNNTPDPVKMYTRNNQLFITGTFPAAGLYKACVYTTNGQAITQVAFTAVAGHNTCSFALKAHLPPAYIIQVTSNSGYVSGKIAIHP